MEKIETNVGETLAEVRKMAESLKKLQDGPLVTTTSDDVPHDNPALTDGDCYLADVIFVDAEDERLRGLRIPNSLAREIKQFLEDNEIKAALFDYRFLHQKRLKEERQMREDPDFEETMEFIPQFSSWSGWHVVGKILTKSYRDPAYTEDFFAAPEMFCESTIHDHPAHALGYETWVRHVLKARLASPDAATLVRAELEMDTEHAETEHATRKRRRVE